MILPNGCVESVPVQNVHTIGIAAVINLRELSNRQSVYIAMAHSAWMSILRNHTVYIWTSNMTKGWYKKGKSGLSDTDEALCITILASPEKISSAK